MESRSALRLSTGFRGINPRAKERRSGLFHGPIDRLIFLRVQFVPIAES